MVPIGDSGEAIEEDLAKAELLERIERLHNKLMEFPAGGNPNCKQMLIATLNACLRRAQALGEEIGLIE